MFLLSQLIFKVITLLSVSYAEIVTPPDSPDEMCRETLAVLSSLSAQPGFADLHQRVLASAATLQDRATLNTNFNLAWLHLISNFNLFRGRLQDSRLIRWHLISSGFLRGVSEWAEGIGDLHFASDIFYKHPDASSQGWQTKPVDDHALEFFAARMVYFDWLSQYVPREKALNSLSKFDSFCRTYLGIEMDEDSGDVRVSPLRKRTAQALRDEYNIRVATSPVHPLGVGFNRGRHFNLVEFAIPDSDIWAVESLQKEEPNELLLGFGDRSVRQFFDILTVMQGGELTYRAEVPDFLFVYPKNGTHYGILRELKFVSLDKPQANIAKAARQLLSGWQNIETTWPGFEIHELEIILPQRSAAVGNLLGNNPDSPGTEYSFDPTPIPTAPHTKLHDIYERNNGGRWTRMMMHNNGRQIPLRVRLLPISQTDYTKFAKTARIDD